MFDPVSRLALARSHGAVHEPSARRVPEARVSVVIPCYNYGDFLPLAVASALDQPGIEVEVVIVDDASADGSGDIAEALAAGDERIRVVRHLENRGHLATYNDGFAAASGEFLALCSADDLVAPGALTRSVSLLSAFPQVGFVYGHTRHFTGSPPPPVTGVRGWITWEGEQWIAARCRSGYNVIQTTEVLMRASILREVGAYRPDLPHSGDLELWMRLATAADVGFVSGPDQAYYRLHSTNMHNTVFGVGSMEGQLVDLEQRWLAFDALFTGPTGRLRDPGRLHRIARRTCAVEALERANYAYVRGFKEFPVERFEKFADSLLPGIERSNAGRALARRKRLGMSSLPVHPLWAPRGLAVRMENGAREWRRHRVGV